MNIGCIRKSELNLVQILMPMKKSSWTEKIIQTLISLFSSSFQTNHMIDLFEMFSQLKII